MDGEPDALSQSDVTPHLLECQMESIKEEYSPLFLLWSTLIGYQPEHCWNWLCFVGAACYADDIALLAPSPSALRFLLCEDFAVKFGLSFKHT